MNCSCSRIGSVWDCKLERIPDWWTQERIKVGECQKQHEEIAAERQAEQRRDKERGSNEN